ncbi:hypothetical protein HK103_004342 [Boothiomyces macroporosus]|uniref:RRM domain-containing protein n=1 Tax=Boothiomyces macroporosus TaxID=261099 RepID=A0AAD5UJP8_9FUNG|nr:hypothetical protein HK103_004342 [Boothiomyces macroporosus]
MTNQANSKPPTDSQTSPYALLEQWKAKQNSLAESAKGEPLSQSNTEQTEKENEIDNTQDMESVALTESDQEVHEEAAVDEKPYSPSNELSAQSLANDDSNPVDQEEIKTEIEDDQGEIIEEEYIPLEEPKVVPAGADPMDEYEEETCAEGSVPLSLPKFVIDTNPDDLSRKRKLDVPDVTSALESGERKRYVKDKGRHDSANPSEVEEGALTSPTSEATPTFANAPAKTITLPELHPANKVVYASPHTTIEQMPTGSKLFVGNLPLDYTNKDEIARVFSHYGNIYDIAFQVMSRTTHGYVQFDNPQSVKEAIKKEDRREMPGGYKLDLQDADERNNRTARRPQKANSPERRRDSRESVTRNRDRDSKAKRDSSPPRDRDRRRDSSPVRDRSSFNRDRDRRNNTPDLPDIQLVAFPDVSRNFVYHVESKCKSNSILFKVNNLSPRVDLKALMEEIQNESHFATIFLERARERTDSVALQIRNQFGLTEYDNIGVNDAFKIITREKDARKGKGPAISNPAMDPNLLFSMMNPAANPAMQFPPQNLMNQMLQGMPQMQNLAQLPPAQNAQLPGQFPPNFNQFNPSFRPQFNQPAQSFNNPASFMNNPNLQALLNQFNNPSLRPGQN